MDEFASTAEHTTSTQYPGTSGDSSAVADGQPVQNPFSLDATTAVQNNSVVSETVTYAGSGIVFNNSYTANVGAAFQSAIVAAENYLQSQFTNSCTINCTFDLASLGANALASNNGGYGYVESYSTLRTALANHATSADDNAAVNSLLNLSDPSNGTGFFVPLGEAQALGLAGPDTAGQQDVTVTFNSNYWNETTFANYQSDAIATLEHELTEGAMGRVGTLGVTANYWQTMDLFRFDQYGNRDFSGDRAYFSTNGSSIDTSRVFNGLGDNADLADWYQNPFGDAFGGGYPGNGYPGTLSATDLQIMDVLGWTRTPADDYSANTSTTGTVSVNGSSTGDLETTGDHDWFKVYLSAGVTYHIAERATGSGGGTLSDAYVRLYNSSGTSVGSNDDGGAGTDSLLVYTAPTSGYYYVDAGAYNDSYTGTYTIDVRQATDQHDFNGDVTSDILWRNSNTGQVEVLPDPWTAFGVD